LNMLQRKLVTIICLVLFAGMQAHAQFPPPAGEPGSTALPFDSACFKFWASGCTVIRGFVNIADTTVTYEGQNRAFYGNDIDAQDTSDEVAVSLGDGGTALLTFPVTIGNGPGFDFAVFENSLSNVFLELGFVEVSSDGQRFVRFPAETHVQTLTQVTTFGNTDATLINNFAGKYRARFGTPFDLEDVKDSTGIDLQRVSHIRIIDAVGCIQPGYCTFDSKGNVVNDPWPTPFHSCGFDLDAVGVINVGAQGVNSATDPRIIHIYPNPVSDHFTVSCDRPDFTLSIQSADGRVIADRIPVHRSGRISMTDAPAGLYLCRVVFPDGDTRVVKVMKL
jgi:hypothetical protein